MKVKISNMPEYAWNHQFIVYSINEKDGSKWFYGAFDEVSKALCAMNFIGGRMADVKEVERSGDNA